MKTKLVFVVAGLGIVLGLWSAYLFSQRPKAQPPAFKPAANPYASGIYANGIVESYQTHGSNINLYPEVPGPITRVLVVEGQSVHKGDVLLAIDDSVQRATAGQQRAQAEAALALLDELKAQPRPEVLQVAKAQVDNAEAGLKNVRDHLAKYEIAYQAVPPTITRDEYDSARNAVTIAEANLLVARRQYELTKAGAWSYDIQNQEMQYAAVSKAAAAAEAMLAKYTIRSPIDGVVLSVQAAAGSYVSPQGAYGTYTGAFGPLVVMGTPQDLLEVRCYVDEILVHRLPPAGEMTAKMFIRGTDISLPLTFERLQPFVSPKVELADQRQERVDVRVLPVIFRLDKPKALSLYPGQLVDVYIGSAQRPK